MLLIGLKKDLRDDSRTVEALEKHLEKPISYNDGLAAAKKVNAYKYLECSAKTGEGVKEIFEHATRAALVKKVAAAPKKNCILL